MVIRYSPWLLGVDFACYLQNFKYINYLFLSPKIFFGKKERLFLCLCYLVWFYSADGYRQGKKGTFSLVHGMANSFTATRNLGQLVVFF